MELPLSNHRRMSVDEFDTRIVLSHAAKQARERGYQNFPIIDVDLHHFESELFAEIGEYIEDPVIRQLLEASTIAGYRGVGALPASLGYQDYGGRIMREPLRRLDALEPKPHRDITLTRARGWIQWASIWPSCSNPDAASRVASAGRGRGGAVPRRQSLAGQYVLAEEPRIRTMLYLPFNYPAATYRAVEEFTGKPGVVGFMVMSNRYRPVHRQRLHEDLCAAGRIQSANRVPRRL